HRRVDRDHGRDDAHGCRDWSDPARPERTTTGRNRFAARPLDDTARKPGAGLWLLSLNQGEQGTECGVRIGVVFAGDTWLQRGRHATFDDAIDVLAHDPVISHLNLTPGIPTGRTQLFGQRLSGSMQ